MSITINLAEFGGIIVALLAVGGLLKNAFPTFPNRLIPAITWALGTLAYLAMTSGWEDPKQWLAAIVTSATATGAHSGIKNTFAAPQPQPTIDLPKVASDDYDPKKP